MPEVFYSSSFSIVTKVLLLKFEALESNPFARVGMNLFGKKKQAAVASPTSAMAKLRENIEVLSKR